VLSVVGGLFNVEPEVPIVNWFTPVAIGGEAALHNWLHPVIEGAETAWAQNVDEIPAAGHPAWPSLLAIVIGAAGLGLARRLLAPRPSGSAEETARYRTPLDRLLYLTWYVDERYGALIVKPVWWPSRAFYKVIDRATIDGIIDGIMGRGSMVLGMVAG